MKLKRKTKLLLKRMGAICICLMMFIPVFTYFIPQEQTVSPELMEAYLESMTNADSIDVGPNAEGNYEVVGVLEDASFAVLWEDGDEPVELIGVEPAKETKAVLEELLADNLVRLEFDVNERNEDNVLQAYAYASDGTFINQEILLRGAGKLKEENQNIMYQEELRVAQEKAQEEMNGIWTEENAEL